MKKAYVAPSLEVEQYRLDANIASHCSAVVTMGDYGGNGPSEPVCNDYLEMVGKQPLPGGINAFAYNVDFWEHNCDCYTTAGGKGFFTS